MKGDFSTWRFKPEDDHQAVLYQQGRVIGDNDLTESEAIALAWRLTAGRDIIGANVAAVPAEEPDGYRVLSAEVDGATVIVRLQPGRIWADGLHTRLVGDPADPTAPVVRRTDYLPEPFNPAGTGTADIGDGVRDAVILEFELEALNGFQDPMRLIEPALGGPDTTERVIPRAALRLLRLDDDETCASIGPRLRDDLAGQGRLTVSLDPPTTVPGDCPVTESGGYSGFEHSLYRIEIAETTAGPARFKWSQFNGGLVGAGLFHGGVDPHVDITANRPAILHADVPDFYLEALAFDAERGHWRVTYCTPAALNADGELDLTEPPTFGAIPGAGQPVFFRLWNGLRAIDDFLDAADPVELRDGIRLLFQSPATASYRPGAFWIFSVRAGEIANPETLVDDAPPEGPMIRRVPLAEITWTDAGDTALGGEIEDCRRRFRPLTNQKICCTYLVGNGTTSFGDFNALEEAAAHLPPDGGRLCLLPGLHLANLDLADARGVEIHGCRHRTFVMPRLAGADRPIVRVAGGSDVAICDLDLFAPFGLAVEFVGTVAAPLREVLVSGCRIMALTHGIRVESAGDVRIVGNQVWLLDQPRGISTIALRATDALIEGNRTGVWPFALTPPTDGGGGDEEPPDPADPCLKPGTLYDNLVAVIVYVLNVWTGTLVAPPPEQPYRARGGIHVKGSSERIDIRRNRIDGGLGHGITLGGVYPDEADTVPGGDDDGDGVPDDVPEPTVSAVGGRFLAVVQNEAGERQAGETLSFAEPEGAVVETALSNENGEIAIDIPSGTYRLSVVPGRAIRRVERFATGAEIAHVIVVGRVADVPVDLDAGFLTRIRILDNEIERMGLSGIGFGVHGRTLGGLTPSGTGMEALAEFVSAVLAPVELLGTTNLVRDLTIRGNRIENNLRIVFTDALRQAALTVAQGGISLATVEGVRIEDNHISGNGRSAAEPAAGIFIGYGEEVLISGNYIVGNGPVDESYRALRSEGLRGGIFVRLASAVVAGATADGVQKPALVIRDNVIDQPAGRAITALAYGPVSCLGNTLNAENEGAWGVIDQMVGAVLILNLGGIHRLSGFADTAARSFADLGNASGIDGVIGTSAYTSRYQRRVEGLLPGGETLFNSNRVRTGPFNLSLTAQLIATIDDFGYDGNQSGTFRPDVTFCNFLGIAHSIRVTDNRFRERALYTAMSALTLALGTTATGGASAMNMTTQNQGDHCIIALSQGTLPVEDRPNQVVFGALCPGEGVDLSPAQYVLVTLLIAWRYAVATDAAFDQAVPALQAGLGKAVHGVGQMQARSTYLYAGEAARYRSRYGAESPQAAALERVAEVRRRSAEVLEVQEQLVRVKTAELPSDGILLEGRVADRAGRAVAGVTVELVTSDDRPLGLAARTNEVGYYALPIDEERRAGLVRTRKVFLRVADDAGKPLGKERVPVRLTGDPVVRNDFEIAARPVVLPVKARETGTVFALPEAPAPRERPARPRSAPRPPEAPSGPAADRAPVPLEAVHGIGPATARRLRAAGVEDASALAALSDARLAEIVGNLAPRLRAAAEAALRADEG